MESKTALVKGMSDTLSKSDNKETEIFCLFFFKYVFAYTWINFVTPIDH